MNYKKIKCNEELYETLFASNITLSNTTLFKNNLENILDEIFLM